MSILTAALRRTYSPVTTATRSHNVWPQVDLLSEGAGMGIMIVCGVLATAAVVAGVGWGGHRFVAPDLEDVLTSGEVARRFVWYLSLVFTAGIAAGVSVIGAGGRLAMRLLAVTAGDSAQGRLTEAERIVGTITVDGTIDFVVFNGIFGGLIAATLYLLVRRLLPPGRLGGIAFGLGLLIVFGATIDPLRKANPDFAIVGPTWLAVLVFAAMSVVFGLAMHGLMSRASVAPAPRSEPAGAPSLPRTGARSRRRLLDHRSSDRGRAVAVGLLVGRRWCGSSARRDGSSAAGWQ